MKHYIKNGEMPLLSDYIVILFFLFNMAIHSKPQPYWANQKTGIFSDRTDNSTYPPTGSPYCKTVCPGTSIETQTCQAGVA